MSAKIIDTRRYKTITKTQLEKKRKQNNNSVLKSRRKIGKKANKISSQDSNSSNISNLRIRKHRERKLEREMLLYSRPQKTVLKEPKQKIYIPKSFVIASTVIVGIFLVYISAKIMKVDEKISVAVFSNTEEKEENIPLENNYNLNIALTSFKDKDVYTSSNLILNDIFKETSLKLIESKDNYTIKYQVAKNIEKITNKEYIITLNDSYKLDATDIVYSVDKLKSSTEDSMYYDRINNIERIEQNGTDKNSVKIVLKEDNPYFPYYLDFPLLDNESKVNGSFNYSLNNGEVIFNRDDKNSNTNLKSIVLKDHNSIDECVEAFRDGKVDVFFATSNNDMQLIGKNDYNVKKYKDGETLFIFGNKNSEIFSRKEVRTALMYSLNREEIVKSSDNNFIELIDLPFLYSSIKYKYDIVGAQNLMNSYSWNRNMYGIYENNINGYKSATLKLLVNSADESKINVANNIKSMALNAGINIEIEALAQEEINSRVSSGNYDIVLASVYLNETPDITFLEEYVNINDVTNQAFKQIENSSVEDLSENIQNLEFVLSDEVACIGIYARNINLVYQKYIYGFDNLNYMNIFNNLKNTGKILE